MKNRTFAFEVNCGDAAVKPGAIAYWKLVVRYDLANRRTTVMRVVISFT